MRSGDDVPMTERVRWFVASNGALLVAVCLVLAAFGGFVAYQSFSGPTTTTEQQTVATWDAAGNYSHGAVVRRDTRAFQEGTVLQNRSVYFTSVTPILNGSYVVEHSGDAEPATVETDLYLTVSAVEVGERRSVLWEVSEPVASDRTESLAAGERMVVPYQVNVTAQSELAERVRSELGSSRGQVRVDLVAETDISTTVVGESVERSRTDVLEVAPRPDTYGVTETTDEMERKQVTETVEVPVEPDPVSRYGALLVLLVGLGGALVVAGMGRTGRLDVDERTRTAIRIEQERESFDEWISTGRLPPVGAERLVTVDSLEGLVDVAIDSNRRVVEDAESETFVVLDGETRYEFRPDRAERLGRSADAGSADAESADVGSADTAGQTDTATGPDELTNESGAEDSLGEE